MRMLDNIEHHPIKYGIIAVSHYIAGSLVPEVNTIDHVHIYPVILECLQVAAYLVSIFVGSITLIAWVRKKLSGE